MLFNSGNSFAQELQEKPLSFRYLYFFLIEIYKIRRGFLYLSPFSQIIRLDLHRPLNSRREQEKYL